MIKGLLSAVLGALIIAAIIVGLIYIIFSGIILWVAKVLLIGFIFAVIVLFLVFFIFILIAIIVLFYYIVEKKPTITPGEYNLDMEKGKHEDDSYK